MEDAPNRIRELRVAAKLSQQRVADAIRVSKMTVSDLERGKIQLTTDYMRRLAPILGVSPADILAPEDNPLALTAEEVEIIRRLRMASPEIHDQFAGVANVILPPASDEGSHQVA